MIQKVIEEEILLDMLVNICWCLSVKLSYKNKDGAQTEYSTRKFIFFNSLKT